MINRLIEWSLRNRFLVACGALLLIAVGVRAIIRTPVDAIPDLSENQVIVFADWGIPNPSIPGISTEDSGVLEFSLVLGR